MSDTMNFGNYLSGEPNPESACTGNLAGRIEGFIVSGQVAGSPLSASDFIVQGTVSGFVANGAADPHPIPEYTLHANKNAYSGNGAEEIDADGVQVTSSEQCMARCHRDWSCDCVVFHRSTATCWKRRNCLAGQFDNDNNYDVYMRPWDLQTTLPPTIQAPSWANSPDSTSTSSAGSTSPASESGSPSLRRTSMSSAESTSTSSADSTSTGSAGSTSTPALQQPLTSDCTTCQAMSLIVWFGFYCF